MRVGLIVLAAGASSRLGWPKQLLTFQGETLLRRAARTALASVCRPIVAVLGADAEKMRPELNGLDVEIIEATDWADGMSASLKAGLTEADEWEAAIIMLCDQPLLTPDILDALAAQSDLAACEYGGTVGVPARFPRCLFPELRVLDESSGAKSVLKKYSETLTRVSFPGGVFDIDTRDDYARLPPASIADRY